MKFKLRNLRFKATFSLIFAAAVCFYNSSYGADSGAAAQDLYCSLIDIMTGNVFTIIGVGISFYAVVNFLLKGEKVFIAYMILGAAITAVPGLFEVYVANLGKIVDRYQPEAAVAPTVGDTTDNDSTPLMPNAQSVSHTSSAWDSDKVGVSFSRYGAPCGLMGADGNAISGEGNRFSPGHSPNP